MTSKRFKNIGNDIFQYGEWWCSANGEHCADVIATAMNELCGQIEVCEQAYQEVKSDAIHLQKKNELLNKDMVIIDNMLNEYYTCDSSETIRHKLTCLLKELDLFRKANDTVEWQAYKEKEFKGL